MESSVGESSSSSSSHVVESSVGQRRRMWASAGRCMSHFRSDFSLMDRWTAVLFGHPLEMKIALYGHALNGNEK